MVIRIPTLRDQTAREARPETRGEIRDHTCLLCGEVRLGTQRSQESPGALTDGDGDSAN